jgi:hypothetical protein
VPRKWYSKRANIQPFLKMPCVRPVCSSIPHYIRIVFAGGTTIAGIHALEANGLRNALISAVEEATKRARQLAVDEPAK